MAASEIKVVFLGESAVGKTSIINRYSQGEFVPDQSSTIGACFTMKKVTLENNTEIKLKIWDTAGQERFRALTPMYYRDAQIAILVFAIDDRNSFEKLPNWIDDLHRDTKVMPPLIIVANKTDLKDKKQVTTEEAEEFAEKSGVSYMECSAKLKVGIDELFVAAAQIAAKFVEKAENDSNRAADSVIAGNESQENSSKGGCC